jgi:large subunit ribosomal protein L17
MRHRVSGKKLNRDYKQRRALYKNLISALIVHGSITTTEAKAKAIQSQVDKLFTKAKKGTVHHRRQIDAVLNQKSIVNQLVDERATDTHRTSGFTRILKLGYRRGDNALKVKLELVDQPAPETAKKDSKVAASTPKAQAKTNSKSTPKKSATKTAKPAKSAPTAKSKTTPPNTQVKAK